MNIKKSFAEVFEKFAKNMYFTHVIFSVFEGQYRSKYDLEGLLLYVDI